MNSSLASSTTPGKTNAKLPLGKADKRTAWDLKDIEAVLVKAKEHTDTVEHQVTQGECPVFECQVT